MIGIDPSDPEAHKKLMALLRRMLSGTFFDDLEMDKLDVMGPYSGSITELPNFEDLFKKLTGGDRPGKKPYFSMSVHSVGPDGRVNKKTFSNLPGYNRQLGSQPQEYGDCEKCSAKTECPMYGRVPEESDRTKNYGFNEPEKIGDGLAHNDSLEDIQKDLKNRAGPDHPLADLFSMFGPPGMRPRKQFSFELCKDEMEDYQQELEAEIASDTPEAPPMSPEELAKYKKKLTGDDPENEETDQ